MRVGVLRRGIVPVLGPQRQVELARVDAHLVVVLGQRLHVDRHTPLLDLRGDGGGQRRVLLLDDEPEPPAVVRSAEIRGQGGTLVRVVREQAGQILVPRVERADRAAQLLRGVGLRLGDDGGVDQIPYGLPHLRIGQDGIGVVVEHQRGLVQALPGGDHQRGVLAQRLGRGRAQRQRHVDLAVPQRLHHGGFVGEIPEGDLRGGRGLPPVGVVAAQRDGHALAELGDGERPGAQGLARVIDGGVLIVDDAGASGQGPGQRRVGGGQRDGDGVLVRIGDLGEMVERLGADVLLLHGLLEGPDHVGGVERMAVGEPQPGLQREGVAEAILGDVPLLGQTGGQGVVLAAGDERFVHVAEQRLLDGGVVVGADVDRGRCVRNADGDGRVGLDRADVVDDVAVLQERPARPQQHA